MSRRHAPGPRGSLLLGSLREITGDPLHFYTATRDEFGDIVRYRLGPFEGHGLFHPDFVHHVLIKNPAHYERSRGHRALASLLGEGLVTTHGEKWKSQRVLLQPAFTPAALDPLESRFREIAARHVALWRADALAGKTFEAENRFLELGIDHAGQLLFGLDLGADRAALEETRRLLQICLGQVDSRVMDPRTPPAWLPTARNREFAAARRAIRATIPTCTGMLAPAWQAIEKIPVAAARERALDGLVLTFLAAASETTALGLSWLMDLLARHPEEQERVREEARAQVEFERLRYTQQSFQEALRLYPPVWAFSRTAGRDDELGGHSIRKGTEVLIVPWAIHRDPRFWPEPDRFRPSRFDLSDPANKRPSTAWIPFSAGPRHCIGFKFALIEGTLTAAALVREFRLTPVHEQAPHPEPLFTLRPRGGVRLHLKPV